MACVEGMLGSRFTVLSELKQIDAAFVLVLISMKITPEHVDLS